MVKHFKISAADLQSLASGRGSCFATDMITVNGHPVGFMYREAPDNAGDSGWRFMSGLESDDYMNDPDNLGIYDVNTVVNYDPGVLPFLDAPVGSAFEKRPGSECFELVEGWAPEDEA